MTSVLPTPRINSCVSESPLVVKKVFADNLFINAMPRRNELPNASEWIKNAPAMSVALKQCAALKKQFLPYFTEGTFIGNCLLTEPTPGAHTAVYVLPNRVLMLLINEHGPRKVSFSTDLGAWLKDKPHWQVNTYNENGRLVSKKKISQSFWHGETHELARKEMCLLEVVTRD